MKTKSTIDASTLRIKVKTELKTQQAREAAKIHSQSTDNEDTFLLSEFTGMKEEKKQISSPKKSRFTDLFFTKKENVAPNLSSNDKTKEYAAVELTELEKLKLSILGLEQNYQICIHIKKSMMK